MRLEGRTALVTGGGQGIGQAICDRLAAEGARVAVLDLNGESAERVAAQLRERGAETIALQTNVANRKQVRAAVARVIAELGHLDILVNNAGIARHQLLDDMPEGDWDDVMNVNAKATFHFCQAVVPHMKERGGGKIVNLASRAILGNARETNYSAAKAAVVGFSRALSLEVAAHNINVNCVSPSMVDTPWTQAYPEEMRQRAIKLIPKGRPAQPREIANVVLFLVSDDAEYVTGQTLHVCGGRSVGMNPW